jgi:hypothetical protein
VEFVATLGLKAWPNMIAGNLTKDGFLFHAYLDTLVLCTDSGYE